MGRIPREQVLYDGCYAHIMSRASSDGWIFRDFGDFNWFKALLLDAKRTFQFRIHHYCLMNTHFHMAVSMTSAERFTNGMKQLKWEYTKWFNRHNARSGPLWRERFKSKVIENEDYLYACGLYIEVNPVKARMVQRAEDWPYSSSAYYQTGKPDQLVDPYDHGDVPDDIDWQDEDTFTKGIGIGTELFKIQLREGAFQSMPVP